MEDVEELISSDCISQALALDAATFVLECRSDSETVEKSRSIGSSIKKACELLEQIETHTVSPSEEQTEQFKKGALKQKVSFNTQLLVVRYCIDAFRLSAENNFKIDHLQYSYGQLKTVKKLLLTVKSQPFSSDEDLDKLLDKLEQQINAATTTKSIFLDQNHYLKYKDTDEQREHTIIFDKLESDQSIILRVGLKALAQHDASDIFSTIRKSDEVELGQSYTNTHQDWQSIKISLKDLNEKPIFLNFTRDNAQKLHLSFSVDVISHDSITLECHGQFKHLADIKNISKQTSEIQPVNQPAKSKHKKKTKSKQDNTVTILCLPNCSTRANSLKQQLTELNFKVKITKFNNASQLSSSLIILTDTQEKSLENKFNKVIETQINHGSDVFIWYCHPTNQYILRQKRARATSNFDYEQVANVENVSTAAELIACFKDPQRAPKLKEITRLISNKNEIELNLALQHRFRMTCQNLIALEYLKQLSALKVETNFATPNAYLKGGPFQLTDESLTIRSLLSFQADGTQDKQALLSYYPKRPPNKLEVKFEHKYLRGLKTKKFTVEEFKHGQLKLKLNEEDSKEFKKHSYPNGLDAAKIVKCNSNSNTLTKQRDSLKRITDWQKTCEDEWPKTCRHKWPESDLAQRNQLLSLKPNSTTQILIGERENTILQQPEIPFVILRNPKISSDKEQLRFLSEVFTGKQVTLCQGPVGTGKSTILSEIIFQQYLHCRGRHSPIIVTSQTNKAVDGVLLKLKQFYNIPVLRAGEKKDNGAKYHPDLEGNLINKNKSCEQSEETKNTLNSEQFEKILNGEVILGGTIEKLTSLMYEKTPLFNALHASQVQLYVDEFGIASIGETLAIMKYANFRLFTIGDPKQLGVMKPNKEVQTTMLQRYGVSHHTAKALESSFFKFIAKQSFFDMPSLKKVYRCLPDIVELVDIHYREPNESNFLIPANSSTSNDTCAVWLIDTTILCQNTIKDIDKRDKEDEQWELNTPQAQIGTKLFSSLLTKTPLTYKDIGIITPYNNQIEVYKDLIHCETDKASKASDEVRHKFLDAQNNVNQFVGSVYPYQGDERYLTIVDLVRHDSLTGNPQSNTGFFTPEMLLVMMSRSKSGPLIIIGDMATFTTSSNSKISKISEHILTFAKNKAQCYQQIEHIDELNINAKFEQWQNFFTHKDSCDE